MDSRRWRGVRAGLQNRRLFVGCLRINFSAQLNTELDNTVKLMYISFTAQGNY